MIEAAEGLGQREGLTERRLWILDAVYRGFDRPSQLADMFKVLPSTITYETAKLNASGLIRSEALPYRGRTLRLSLTARGEAIQRELIQLLNGLLLPSVTATSPRDLQAFIEVGRKIIDSIPPGTPKDE